MWSSLFFLMLRRPPRSTPRHTLALHDALPIYRREGIAAAQQAAVGLLLLDKYRGRAADLAVEEAGKRPLAGRPQARAEEHTSELPSLMRISYAVHCLKHKRMQIAHHSGP